MTIELVCGMFLLEISFGGFGYAFARSTDVPFVASMSCLVSIVLILDALKILS